MSRLEDLKKTTNLKDLAKLLGYEPKYLSFILYKILEEERYTKFEISKKSGGNREITAPTEKLKLLQKRLTELLYDCVEEINKNHKNKPISHGFQKNLSIVTNAKLHTGKRYVFNIDLSDFFPSINFGRVRGFFIKNNNFNLTEKVATIIAQIACYNNQLPQGSPCSPVISNLVAQILDVRLVKLAKKYGLTYSRYADDITFSTNKKTFPCEVAFKLNDEESKWGAGEELTKIIEGSGFSINSKKSRMQYKLSRQSVTGLVVNKRANVTKEYYYHARSMCNSLFRTGSFYINGSKQEEIGEEKTSKPKNTINQLQGILGHIFYVKNISKTSNTIEGIRKLYEKFIYFKNFYFLDKPVIYCEGKTDKVYIKCAVNILWQNYPKLAYQENNIIKNNFKFFNYTKRIANVCNLAEGTSGMKYLISAYERLLLPYKCNGKQHPVIFLIDNDDGAREIYSTIKEIYFPSDNDKKKKKKKANPDQEIVGDKDFYYIKENLYVVPIPKIDNKLTKIEDFFEQSVLNTPLEGKTFNVENTSSGNTNQYGKHIFAEKVIKPNYKNINFDGFRPILNRIVAVIDDYQERHIGT
ncbi:MAG: retron Ec67 family RNA-directed DNA polymerase/endonuclease [Alphaproteobacteria bacterium]